MENDKKKKKINFLEVIIYLYILGGIVFILFGPKLSNFGKKDGNYSPQRHCYSNIRVLQGAVEMYNMDSSTMMDRLDVDLLIKGKYLKERPISPHPNCNYSENGDLSGDGVVVCSIHGGLTSKGPYDDDNYVDDYFRKIRRDKIIKEIKSRLNYVFIWPLFLPIISEWGNN